MNFVTYVDKVHKELESFDYPTLVEEFKVEDVARSMGAALSIFYMDGMSFRMAALCIYGLTWSMQIIPQAAKMTRN